MLEPLLQSNPSAFLTARQERIKSLLAAADVSALQSVLDEDKANLATLQQELNRIGDALVSIQKIAGYNL